MMTITVTMRKVHCTDDDYSDYEDDSDDDYCDNQDESVMKPTVTTRLCYAYCHYKDESGDD